MPTYEYVCQACGHEFELFQSMKDRVRRTCPKCRKASLKRQIGTGAGIIFRGSGFYQTDYRSDSYKKAADAEKKSADGSDKKAAKDTKDSKDTKDKPAAKDAAEKPRRPKGSGPKSAPE